LGGGLKFNRRGEKELDPKDIKGKVVGAVWRGKQNERNKTA